MHNKKYRCWDTRNQQMVYSDKEDCFYINTKGVLFMYAIPKSESGIGDTVYHKDYNVMGYTGIRSINNTKEELYLGDVVYIAGTGRSVVEYCPIAGVIFSCIKDPFEVNHCQDVLMERDLGCLVGNICANPELIVGKESFFLRGEV